MTSASVLVSFGQQALMLALALSLPLLAVALLVGLLTTVFQAATQLQDPALTHLPRLVAVALVLALSAPWMGRQIAAFALRAFTGG